MSAWEADLPVATRSPSGTSKTYNLSDEHKQILNAAFAFANEQMTMFAGSQAPKLMNALRRGFNFETLDEGFQLDGKPYTILAVAHKGQAAGPDSWLALEPHVAKRGMAFHALVLGLHFEIAKIDKRFMPNVSTWDTITERNGEKKVIAVTRCHLTPNGKPLGVCRKDDRVKKTPAPPTASIPAVAPANPWNISNFVSDDPADDGKGNTMGPEPVESDFDLF